MQLLDLKYGAFGLDINDSSVKIVKLEKKHGKFSVASFGRTEIKPGIVELGVIKDQKAVAEAIRLALRNVKGKKIRAEHAVISLPEEESFLQVIQMPLMSDEELKSAIIFEAENYIPIPVNEAYLDFQIIQPIKNDLNHIDVLIVAAPKQVVDSYINCVRAAGLIPLLAELESQSVARALIKNETSESPVVIVDIGKTSIDFIVFSGHSIRFTCSLPVFQNQIEDAISKTMQIPASEAEKIKVKYGLSGFSTNVPTKTAEPIDPDAKKVFEIVSPIFEELAMQIKRYVDFYQEHAAHEHLFVESKVKKIILCGGGAGLKKLPEFLTQETGIPTEVGNAGGQSPEFLAFATAIGTALAGINIEKND